jgi:hypothetical protein
VSFTKPILLPNRGRFAAEPDGDGWRFAVLRGKSDETHMVGELDAAQ